MAGKKINSNKKVLKKITKKSINAGKKSNSPSAKKIDIRKKLSKRLATIKSGAKFAAKTESVSGAVRKEMTIGETIEKFPESAQVMLQHGLHCIGCHVALWETIEQGASAHGVDPDKLVHEINKEISKKAGK
jgi:hybrid cluster-associated redox disulfide protein